MRLEILDEAEEEFQHAARWYEQRKSGLGHIFLDQFWNGFDQIVQHPRRYSRYSSSRSREIRRVLMDSFPYAIVYELIGDQPTVLAVAHTKKKPGYWMKRQPT